MAHEWMCAGQHQGCSWSQAVPKLALAPEWRTWEPGSLWPSRAAVLMLPANLDGTEGLDLPCPGDPAPPHGQLRFEVNSWHHKLGRLFPLQPIDPGEVPFGRERHQSQLIYLKTLSCNN